MVLLGLEVLAGLVREALPESDKFCLKALHVSMHKKVEQIAQAQKYIFQYAKFLTKLWGRGILYIFEVRRERAERVLSDVA